MASCSFCERALDDADSCTKNVVLYPDPDLDDGGQWLFAIPFGQEERDDVDLAAMDDSSCCPDCDISLGGYHHPGCGVEESPLTREPLAGEITGLTDARRPYHARAQGDPQELLEIDTDPRAN